MKTIIMVLTILILSSCGGNKRTAEMFKEKQITLRAAKIEMIQLQTVMAAACKSDSNPGLCVAVITMSNNSKPSDNSNGIPRMSNPMADVTKTLIRTGASAYFGKLAADTVTSGYNAIRDTATGVSGQDNSITVNGNYRNNSNDTIDNSDNSIADSYNTDNSISDSNNDNSVDNSVNNPVSDSNNDNSDNSDNSNRDNVLPVDPSGGN